MRMKRFIDSLKFSSDEDAAWLLACLRMGGDITQVVNVKTPRPNEYVYLMRLHRTTT